MKYFISQSWEILESSKMIIPVNVLYKTQWSKMIQDRPSTIKIGVRVSLAKCSRGWCWEFLKSWSTSGWRKGVFLPLSVSWVSQALKNIFPTLKYISPFPGDPQCRDAFGSCWRLGELPNWWGSSCCLWHGVSCPRHSNMCPDLPLRPSVKLSPAGTQGLSSPSRLLH